MFVEWKNGGNVGNKSFYYFNNFSEKNYGIVISNFMLLDCNLKAIVKTTDDFTLVYENAYCLLLSSIINKKRIQKFWENL